MPRERIGGDLMQVRFPDGTFAAIDAVATVRSEFIRGAVADALDGPGRIKRAPKKSEIRATSVPSPREADKAALLEALRARRMSSREAEAAMGWPGLRYRNAERDLMASGKVLAQGGVLVVWGE